MQNGRARQPAAKDLCLTVFVHSTRRFASLGALSMALSACGGGSSTGSAPVVPGASPSPQATTIGIIPGVQPTVQPSPGGSSTVDTAAYVCPTSLALPSSAVRPVANGEAVRRVARRPTVATEVTPATSRLIAVNSDARSSSVQKTVLAARESALGAARVRAYAFTHANIVTHVLAVPAAQADRIASRLRQTAGVGAVGFTGTRRYPSSVTQPFYPNDPYFTGFATTAAPAAGGTAPPATLRAAPLVESSGVPGQWDMHVMRLEYAFAYSRPNNGSGVTNGAALGSSAVKIALIDTGVDATHPELESKVVYTRCFITNANNVQSSSNFATDADGHGTDVAGIAGAATNNGLGFSAAGGNVALYGYRVFPTPDDNCAKSTSADAQCGTSTQDIASAIEDAVQNHVNIISLSLGGAGCVNGDDPDPAEGAAVADAIAANIIVVAAAGNGAGPPVEAPACDPGVIAVGATSLADGNANASAKTGGSATAPFEYVASYTDFGSPGAVVGSSSAWGIVAPGGDPTGSTDVDDLHWIENLWTSTPFMATASDTTFAGNCAGDYPTQSGTPDCRVLIAGTSMATPHVAGAAALIVAANPAYQSASRMKQLLCATADDIGDPNQGCGRLDVYRAMATAVGDPSPPAANPTP